VIEVSGRHGPGRDFVALFVAGWVHRLGWNIDWWFGLVLALPGTSHEFLNRLEDQAACVGSNL
jgi:hypothetical protein